MINDIWIDESKPYYELQIEDVDGWFETYGSASEDKLIWIARSTFFGKKHVRIIFKVPGQPDITTKDFYTQPDKLPDSYSSGNWINDDFPWEYPNDPTDPLSPSDTDEELREFYNNYDEDYEFVSPLVDIISQILVDISVKDYVIDKLEARVKALEEKLNS